MKQAKDTVIFLSQKIFNIVNQMKSTHYAIQTILFYVLTEILITTSLVGNVEEWKLIDEFKFRGKYYIF